MIIKTYTSKIGINRNRITTYSMFFENYNSKWFNLHFIMRRKVQTIIGMTQIMKKNCFIFPLMTLSFCFINIMTSRPSKEPSSFFFILTSRVLSSINYIFETFYISHFPLLISLSFNQEIEQKRIIY